MPTAHVPLFSVVIPVYNDVVRLADCLRAIEAQTLDPALFEVIVIDNGSQSPPHALVGEHGFARLMQEPAAGSYNARNTGCRGARGRYLAFTDADCRPHPGWLSEALRYFESHPEVAAIGGRIELALGDPPTPSEVFERVFAFQQERYVHQFGFAATANMLVRRDVFERVGPFDGQLKTGGDRQWGQRMTVAGYRMDYVADVSVTHPARSSIRELINKRRRLTAAAGAVVPLLSQLVPGQPQRPYRAIPRGWRRLRAMVLSPRELGISRLQGWQLLGVVLMLDAAGYCERIRLQLGGSPVR